MSLQDALTINIPAWMVGEATSLGSLSMEFRNGRADSSISFQFPIEGILARGLLWDALTIWLNASANQIRSLHSADWYLPRSIDALDEFLDSRQRVVSSDATYVPGWMTGKAICRLDDRVYPIEIPIVSICHINQGVIESLSEDYKKRQADVGDLTRSSGLGYLATPRIRGRHDYAAKEEALNNFLGMAPADIYTLISTLIHSNESSQGDENE